MKDIVPTDRLARYGMAGVSGTVIGAGLLVLRAVTGAVAGFSVVGLVIGGALILAGMNTARKSSTRDDRAGGLIVLAAGALTAGASLPIVGGLASGMMGLAGTGLLVFGGFSLFRFFKGLQARR